MVSFSDSKKERHTIGQTERWLSIVLFFNHMKYNQLDVTSSCDLHSNHIIGYISRNYKNEKQCN